MDGDSSDVLLKHADVAMYEAKRDGGNTIRPYKKPMAASNSDSLGGPNTAEPAPHSIVEQRRPTKAR